MVGLKALRESANYSQQRLAEMLKTTQQTIARWESGEAEPNLAALRDLALIFGTSVDELLGVSRLPAKPSSTTYHLFTGGAQDGFWGHIGLKLSDGPSRWFPVTLGTVERVSGELANSGPDTWISFSTLANRHVAFRPTTVRKVWLLDDACDQPSEDWELDLPYQGLPLEMYRAFEQLHDISLGEEAWRSAAEALPKEARRGERLGGNPEQWAAFLRELAKGFDGEVSDAFLRSIAETYVEERLYEEDRFYRYMHDTTVHYVDGGSESFWVEDRDLKDFIFELDVGQVPAMLRLEHFGGDAEPYYSTSKLSAVVMPLLDLSGAFGEDQDDDEGEDG